MSNIKGLAIYYPYPILYDDPAPWEKEPKGEKYDFYDLVDQAEFSHFISGTGPDIRVHDGDYDFKVRNNLEGEDNFTITYCLAKKLLPNDSPRVFARNLIHKMAYYMHEYCCKQTFIHHKNLVKNEYNKTGNPNLSF